MNAVSGTKMLYMFLYIFLSPRIGTGTEQVLHTGLLIRPVAYLSIYFLLQI